MQLCFSVCITKVNVISKEISSFLLVCCSYTNSKSIDTEQLAEHQMIDNINPAVLSIGDLVERAAPRLGRALPRFGRASPRLGRRALLHSFSHLNSLDPYYIENNDEMDDSLQELDSFVNGKRAAPRLGRSI